MTYPIVSEKPASLQAVAHDPFIDDLRPRPGAPAPFVPAPAPSQARRDR